MDRRFFLKSMCVTATCRALPGLAAELPTPATPFIEFDLGSPLMEPAATETDDRFRFKIVGVGGAGCRALEHMIREGVSDAEFVAVDTDFKALARHAASGKLCLPKVSPGTVTQPGLDTIAAEAQREAIRTSLVGAHMVFITASMTDDTGASVSQVVAEVAREMGILTIGVICKPFPFEGGERLASAETGIVALLQRVDSLIVIPNEPLIAGLGDDSSSVECFRLANEALRNAIVAIADIVTFPGLVGVDFEDVRTVIGVRGLARIGSAVAAGIDRAHSTAKQAITSLSLAGIDPHGTGGLLVNITAAKNSLKMKEINEVMNAVKASAAEDAHIIFGAVHDEKMHDAIRVTVVATGLDWPGAPRPPSVKGIARQSVTVKELADSGVDTFDIPAFLRKGNI